MWACPAVRARPGRVPELPTQTVTNRTFAAGRLALAQSLLPTHARVMTLRPQTHEIPAADDVSLDELFAGIRTVAELNEIIRAGLVEARRSFLA